MERRIIECVPNFSEGRDLHKVERIVDAFRAREGVKLLDYSNDMDHNRMVVTAIGTPEAMKQAVVEAVGIAIQAIDLTKHRGEHPRMGAVDVIPFIPIQGLSVADADALAKEVGQALGDTYQLPVFLYEQSATAPHRQNLAAVRKGEFEGLSAKMLSPDWQPDYGPSTPHPTAGAVAVGARMPLIAFNVNLHTTDLSIAKAIARKIRFSSGGLPAVKAMGVEIKAFGLVQVSMNLTDYTQTSIYQVVETIRQEALACGVTVAGSELIGLMPLEALVESAGAYLGLSGFSAQQIIETHLL